MKVRQIIFMLLILFILQIIFIPFISAQTVLSVNGTYGAGSVVVGTSNGVKFVPVANVTLVSVARPINTTKPGCLVIRDDNAAVIASSTYSGSNCGLNASLLAGVTYRIATNGSGNETNAAVNGGAGFPVIYPTLGNFTMGCSGSIPVGCDSNNSIAYDIQNITLLFDTPGASNLVELLFPLDDFITILTEYNFNATLTPANNSAFSTVNATLFFWNSTGSLVTKVNRSISSSSATIFNFNVSSIGFGNYLWNVFGCFQNATALECLFSSDGNRTFMRQSFTETGSSYPVSIYDTDRGIFEINISVDSSAEFFSASLNYSGRLYNYDTATEVSPGFFNIKRAIDIPPVSATTQRNFTWIINLDLGGSFTTLVSNSSSHFVNYSNFTTTGSIYAINYTIYDEETLLPIFGSLDANFEWYLGAGNETRNNSFMMPKANSFWYYNDPANRNFTMYNQIDIFNATRSLAGIGFNQSYNDRAFDFRNERITANARNQSLFLLPSNNGTNFIVTVRDSGLKLLPDHMIKIYRYYPGDDSFRLVESKITDSFGQISVRVIENNVRYRVDFYNQHNRLIKSENNVFFICRSLICNAEFIIQDELGFFGNFNNLTDYDFTLSYNNDTTTFSFVWNDNRDDDSIHRLQVTRYLFNGTTEVCNTNSSSNIGILSCDVGDQRASYQAQAFRSVDGVERRIGQLSISVGGSSDIFGREGLIWGFFLTMTMILIGVFWPPGGIIFYLVTVFALGFLDIVYMNPAIIVAQALIGALFIWAFRG